MTPRTGAQTGSNAGEVAHAVDRTINVLVVQLHQDSRADEAMVGGQFSDLTPLRQPHHFQPFGFEVKQPGPPHLVGDRGESHKA